MISRCRNRFSHPETYGSTMGRPWENQGHGNPYTSSRKRRKPCTAGTRGCQLARLPHRQPVRSSRMLHRPPPRPRRTPERTIYPPTRRKTPRAAVLPRSTTNPNQLLHRHRTNHRPLDRVHQNPTPENEQKSTGPAEQCSAASPTATSTRSNPHDHQLDRHQSPTG